VIAIATEGDTALDKLADYRIEIPGLTMCSRPC
jgi:hypothetical protein